MLREYNNKLRNALGQKEMPKDSTFDVGTVTSLLAENDQSVTGVRENQQKIPVQSSTDEVIVSRPVMKVKHEAVFRAEFPIIAPAVGYISRRFESDKGHLGIDYAGKIGSLIIASADGYVVFAGYTADDGNTVMISHGGGFLTIYKHNQSVLKTVGEFVKRGEPIALLGNSGRTSFGPHMHFEVWNNGKAQNPNDYMIASEL